jgi:spermidine synthase
LSYIQIGSAIAVLLVIGLYSYGIGEDGAVVWSPYYKVVYYPSTRNIWTNNLGHQQIAEIPDQAAMYLLPHRLAEAAQDRTFDDVLVIGAGSGNDVAAALYAGAKHVDAVEIEPAIIDLGRQLHPNHPYDDPRVTIYNDDGRSFLRKTKRKYDLVVFALVDSLVLHSGYSSLRLESFLFTEESLADAKKVLKPGGVLAMYNYFRQGWVVGRLVTMARDATGSEPMTISVPYQAEIRATDSELGHITFILSDVKTASGNSTVQAIHEMLDHRGASSNIRTSHVDTAGLGPVPRDDWPFLYLRGAIIPALNIRGMILIAVLSIVLLMSFAPMRSIHLNWTMLFLGAGFMLLETKAVVHMALLFGATWIVNAIVFAAILVMILCANLFVLIVQPRRLWPYYLLLGAALLVNIIVPMNSFLALGGIAKVAESCAVVFVPVFFAGVIFGTFFRDSQQPDVDFGSNVIGIILGGISEYFSLVLGFNHLLLIAMAFYALSWLLKRRIGTIPSAC